MSKSREYSRKEIRQFVRIHNEMNRDWILDAYWKGEPVDQIANAFGRSYSAVRTLLFKHRFDRVWMGSKEIASLSARLNR